MDTGAISEIVTSRTCALVAARNVSTVADAANGGRRTIVDCYTRVANVCVTCCAGTRVVAVAVICAHFGAVCAGVGAGALREAVGVVAGVVHEPRVAGTRVAASQIRVAGHVEVCARLILTANARRLEALVDVSTTVSVRLQRQQTVRTRARVIVAHREVRLAEFGELAHVVCCRARVISYYLQRYNTGINLHLKINCTIKIQHSYVGHHKSVRIN